MSEVSSTPSVSSPTSTSGAASVGAETTSSAPPSASPSTGSHPTGSGRSPTGTNGQLGSAGQQSPKSTPEELFEVIVNKKPVKMTRQELINNASMAYSANERFREAASQKQQVERIISQAKENPIQALMDPALGLSKDQIRDAFESWYAKEYIEPETLTEEQRQLRDYQEKLSRYEAREKEEQERVARQKQEEIVSKEREFYQNQIVEALEKSGLTKSPFFASRMAFYMRENLLKGWEAPTDMIVQQVKDEFKGMLGNLQETASAEQLIELFGEGIINKIRQYDLQKLRDKRKIQPQQVTATPNGMGHGRPDYSEVNRRLREMRMGR